jgi:cytochrome c oxidase cbb3-type subunit III
MRYLEKESPVTRLFFAALHTFTLHALAALNAKQRLVLLDTRVKSVWQTAYIAGSFPLPCYSNFDEVTAALPKDVMIVAYCSCPRAAADYVIDELRERGYSRTAVLYEGIFGWMNAGLPVVRGEIAAKVL